MTAYAHKDNGTTAQAHRLTVAEYQDFAAWASSVGLTYTGGEGETITLPTGGTCELGQWVAKINGDFIAFEDTEFNNQFELA